ncbi:MAG: peptidase M48 [Candidatus Marinimicrobia bacterium]|nr:peptidase M48 [Candidatus Neomarinimicrobiota bacterium]
MNYFLLIITTFLIFEYVLEIFSKYYNLKYLKANLPKEFNNFYSQKKYASSQEYTKENIKFSIYTSTTNLLIMLSIISLGGFNYLDLFLRNFNIKNDILLGVLYFVIIILFNTILSLPKSYYSIFYIEQKYGFNKSSKSLFILDTIKQIILSLIIVSIIIFLLLTSYEYLETYAWFFCWIFLSIIIVLMPIIYINVIAPFFNKFQKLENGTLKEKIQYYSQKVKFPLQEIYIVDGSKRSSHSNAYFTGFGSNKRIVLFDTLLKNHSDDEIIAIIAHEVGHFKKKHIITNTIISIFSIGTMFYLLDFFIKNKLLFDAFQMDYISNYAGIVFFSILYSPINMVLSIILNAYSRKNEYDADKYSVETIDDKKNLILALKNLSVSNLSNLTPHPFYVFLNYSHPPILKRIEAIQNLK